MDLSGQSWLPRQGGASGKESASNAGDIRDECSIPGDSLPGESSFSRKIPWRRKWQPTPVFLPGESMDRGAWQATVHGVARVRHDLVTKERERYSFWFSNKCL